MKTVELSAALGQAQVVENLKNFVGVDAQGAAALMTPERLAAVAGGKMGKQVTVEAGQSYDFDSSYNILYIAETFHSAYITLIAGAFGQLESNVCINTGFKITSALPVELVKGEIYLSKVGGGVMKLTNNTDKKCVFKIVII